MPLTHDDYTVAWVCALPLEMTAAKMMLDKVHPPLSQPNSDHNAYTLGSVSGHSVVIACLPSGVYGTTSAAVVLSQMLTTFPALRFGLMVGIGGCVLSKNADIRLGDVVVSIPTAVSGGVIQYNYGKTLRDGRFERTGSLNKPPQLLLTVVSQLRSNVLVENATLERSASEILQNHKTLRKQFSHPDEDQLFQASYDHKNDMEMWIKGSHTAPPLKSFLPRSENGHVLFTSRNRKLAVKVASPNVLSVPDVDENTAMKILQKLLIKEGLLFDNDITTALLEQLGFLPLAISQAAAYINENQITLSDYLSLLKEHETSAAELLSEEFEDDRRYDETPNRVLTTWLVSFQQIQQLDELSADCLSFMACINPRDIPQSILPPAPSAKKRVDALGLLSAYSFISEHVGKGSFSLHRLVHLATRNWMRKNQVFDRWNQGLWRIYLPHALYLTNSPEFRHNYSEYVDFPLRVGRSLQIEGRYDEAKTLFVENLSVREKALGAEHIDSLASVTYLGSVLEDQGKYKEAEAMYRRVLDGREKGLGPEHPDTLTSISHLGWALKEQVKYEEAEAMHRRALKGREKALGSEHPDTLDSVTYRPDFLCQVLAFPFRFGAQTLAAFAH
ncbi:Tetratricopeptide-like helical [Penicillium daleae]|uniref:Tetratricopeptide-like helical n=1 Tax=Penicillium daleae TaxID=63821 RepID=A0AAD6CC68_9EURO|nr:Tetratricopeptide-like helical [Penicillium daleae]KAJ5455855.1 Tetratricopeptide-like helical [Penicillium daleae]